ncbi:uncharacterized protein B0H18DRAFT_981926 [Fomitopsis serialis]|uniref:uncharacterized protein n=1 Tax=Fomitopsis serialis TaxID=139415 RepID=UPI002008A4D5|nr:uncharacterized protein B0H18DRAFT_981926 [Neoantrodia serialis]KAH9933770.1 hypothetical protein B0H18DRAFT_981926 [Neoantrodia serialis]
MDIVETGMRGRTKTLVSLVLWPKPRLCGSEVVSKVQDPPVESFCSDWEAEMNDDSWRSVSRPPQGILTRDFEGGKAAGYVPYVRVVRVQSNAGGKYREASCQWKTALPFVKEVGPSQPVQSRWAVMSDEEAKRTAGPSEKNNLFSIREAPEITSSPVVRWARRSVLSSTAHRYSTIHPRATHGERTDHRAAHQRSCGTPRTFSVQSYIRVARAKGEVTVECLILRQMTM